MEPNTPLQLAINALPVEDSDAYRQVLKGRPDLVVSESNPDWFLLSNKQSAALSAAGLAKYWSERKKAFGEERFARSLTDLSGDGALLPGDIELLQTGFMVVLPPDSQGRHVVCIDSGRVTQQVDRLSYTRICFFVGHSLLQLPPSARATSNTELVLVRRLNLPMLKNPAAVAPSLDKSLRTFEEVLPLTVHALHHCLEVQGVKVQRFAASTMPAVMSRIGRGLVSKAMLHTVKGPKDMAIKLQEKGMIHLPETFGGAWSYTNFESWLGNVSRQPESFDPDGCEDAALINTLDKFVRNYEVDGDTMNPKAHFAFGVLGMLQEEEKCSLRELLGQNDTQEVLLALCGEPMLSVGEILKECVEEITTEQGGVIDETLKEVSEELLDTLTGGGSAVVAQDPSSTQTTAQAENAELLLEVSNLIDETSEKSVLPLAVQSCLGVLCLLEDEQGRTVIEMLQDTSVVELLDKTLEHGDSGGTEGGMECESAILDLLAERIERTAKDILRGDDSAHQVLGRGDDLSRELGRLDNAECEELVGNVVDKALRPLTQM